MNRYTITEEVIDTIECIKVLDNFSFQFPFTGDGSDDVRYNVSWQSVPYYHLSDGESAVSCGTCFNCRTIKTAIDAIRSCLLVSKHSEVCLKEKKALDCAGIKKRALPGICSG